MMPRTIVQSQQVPRVYSRRGRTLDCLGSFKTGDVRAATPTAGRRVRSRVWMQFLFERKNVEQVPR